MRLKDIILNQSMLKNVGICGNKPFVIVHSNGVSKMTYLPAYGETKVITHQGQVKRVKFDEGEEF